MAIFNSYVSLPEGMFWVQDRPFFIIVTIVLPFWWVWPFQFWPVSRKELDFTWLLDATGLHFSGGFFPDSASHPKSAPESPRCFVSVTVFGAAPFTSLACAPQCPGIAITVPCCCCGCCCCIGIGIGCIPCICATCATPTLLPTLLMLAGLPADADGQLKNWLDGYGMLWFKNLVPSNWAGG